MGDHGLGQFGVWRGGTRSVTPENAVEIEQLGYGAIWIGSSRKPSLKFVEPLLEATSTITVATGIADVWSNPPKELAASFHRVEQHFPGRFLLGIGIGHPEASQDYTKPFQTLVDYLDVLDGEGVPKERLALAALGPRVLKLSADRTAGAHPYLTSPEHTRFAREILGPDALLAPEQKVVLDTDSESARAVGRETAEIYLQLKNYRANLNRLGYADADIDNGGSDALIDALVVHGDAAAVAAGLRAHVDAGADHVCIQVLPMFDDAMPALRVLAKELGLSAPR
ncbi:LLM class F420-dependent oxidoreductase [Aldersonia kunmingensis]|uniref:LLM class F420-dependent oxidoreductase n=1 Tax=Aldersonia kunmingensis TaxID=408066 RepID=UPI00083468F7|nr:LLM class F420-dependent oxidoreductase [Aldersonia kunmingensis]